MLQHLDKPLSDDTGSAKNTDRNLVAHGYLEFYNMLLVGKVIEVEAVQEGR